MSWDDWEEEYGLLKTGVDGIELSRKTKKSPWFQNKHRTHNTNNNNNMKHKLQEEEQQQQKEVDNNFNI